MAASPLALYCGWLKPLGHLETPFCLKGRSGKGLKPIALQLNS